MRLAEQKGRHCPFCGVEFFRIQVFVPLDVACNSCREAILAAIRECAYTVIQRPGQLPELILKEKKS
jgi:hypothetical protein